MKSMMKTTSIILAAAMVLVIGPAAMAGPQESMQGALVSLQKARMSSAAPVKTRNLARAKEQLEAAAYDGGGQRAAAIALVTQAIGSVNALRLDMADRQIDAAMVKIRHAIQAIKQERAAGMRRGARK